MTTRRVSYRVVPAGSGWGAVRRVEWPQLDQHAYPPVYHPLGVYAHKADAEAKCAADHAQELEFAGETRSEVLPLERTA